MRLAARLELGKSQPAEPPDWQEPRGKKSSDGKPAMRVALVSGNREQLPDAVIPLGILYVEASLPGRHVAKLLTQRQARLRLHPDQQKRGEQGEC